MTKTAMWGALATLAAISSGCGSSQPEEQTTPTCVGLPTNPDCIIAVNERSFIRAAVAITDGVSTATISHTPGRFCMSGTLEPPPNNWGALLGLPLTRATSRNGTPTTIDAPFTASARGITQLQFTVDPPPAAGLGVHLTAVERADCLDIPDCFTAAPFVLGNAGGYEILVEESGLVTAALASFVQPNWGDPALALDPNLITSLQFAPSSLRGVAVPYDFCVRDVRFLDDGGREVLP